MQEQLLLLVLKTVQCVVYQYTVELFFVCYHHTMTVDQLLLFVTLAYDSHTLTSQVQHRPETASLYINNCCCYRVLVES